MPLQSNRSGMPFNVHKKEITRAHPISHVARTVGFPLGEFSALPRTKPEVGRLSRQFLYYLEVISRACGHSSVERRGDGTTRRGQRLCKPAPFIAMWST